MTRKQMEERLAAYCDSQGFCDECEIGIRNEICDFESMSDELLKALYSVVFKILITDDLTGVVKEEPESITEIIEEVKNNICDHYCKYPGEISDYDEMLETVCGKCPLNRL